MAGKTKLRKWLDRQPYGTSARLAEWLDDHRSNVSAWAAGRRRIPEWFCPDIAEFSGYELTCQDLRPDIDWGAK